MDRVHHAQLPRQSPRDREGALQPTPGSPLPAAPSLVSVPVMRLANAGSSTRANVISRASQMTTGWPQPAHTETLLRSLPAVSMPPRFPRVPSSRRPRSTPEHPQLAFLVAK
jgi:hypothetical protein